MDGGITELVEMGQNSKPAEKSLRTGNVDRDDVERLVKEDAMAYKRKGKKSKPKGK